MRSCYRAYCNWDADPLGNTSAGREVITPPSQTSRFSGCTHFGRLYFANHESSRIDLYAERCRICIGDVAPSVCNWARGMPFKGVLKGNRHLGGHNHEHRENELTDLNPQAKQMADESMVRN